jgi:hypothetical protein
MKITVNEFLQIWNNSNSLKDIEAKTGIKYLSCVIKASRLRKKGFAVKQFKPHIRKPKPEPEPKIVPLDRAFL